MKWIAFFLGGILSLSACKPSGETCITSTAGLRRFVCSDTLQVRAEEVCDEEEVVERTIEYDTIAGKVVPVRVVTHRSKQAKLATQSLSNRQVHEQQRDSTWQYVVIDRQPGVPRSSNCLLKIGYGLAALLLLILLLINKLRK